MKNVLVLLMALAVQLFATPVMAADIFDAPCSRYNVPKSLVLAIAKTESSLDPWCVNVAGKDFRSRTREDALKVIYAARAKGLSHDVGIMQVNSWWLRRLNISPETAIEPRINAMIGVWILAQEIQKHGLNWKAIAYYHTPLHKNPARGRWYAATVLKKMHF